MQGKITSYRYVLFITLIGVFFIASIYLFFDKTLIKNWLLKNAQINNDEDCSLAENTECYSGEDVFFVSCGGFF